MLLPTITALIGIAACLPSTPRSQSSNDLIVRKVPDHVRPYIVRAYTLDGYRVGSQIYRFPVTGPSSDNAFTLISTAAPSSTSLGVLPHIHQRHYENFYCLRGRVALWASKDNTTSGRILTPGDYGAVPENTTHTFQMLDPFNELVGVIQPGGFEELFYFLASDNYTSPTHSPFPQGNFSDPGGDANLITTLEKFDVYAKLAFAPPTSFNANGATEDGAVWHSGPNALASDANTPFFVANGYGPKYLAGSAASSYTILEPFVTRTQSNGTFAQGTLTLSQPLEGSSPQTYSFPGHTALEVVGGLVSVEVGGYEGTTELSVGDVVFVPKNTEFRFWGAAAWSKVLYVGAGNETLDAEIVKEGKVWEGVTWPQ